MGAVIVNPLQSSLVRSIHADPLDTFAGPAEASSRHPEEAALVAALQAGSEEAFAQLIAQYSAPLYSLIARSLPNPADAADIAQDVFIKVFRSVRNFHGDCSLRTWMYRIALHESSNSKRWWSRHKRQEVTIDGDTSEESENGWFPLRESLADTRDGPFELARRAELRAVVESALSEVPENFRTVVILREIEGMTYDEIAAILEINMGTVKSRLLRGRAALRNLLSQRLPEWGAAAGHVSGNGTLPKKMPRAESAGRVATSKGMGR
ncbi:sigma-70 family RNA polymerase sigma factor [Terriglobus sp.]|uniref:sigma-70 family RNA polymerase sigma factor n=1 Tax=Terriglobus sp. TaxID=1889013 RepID=UPI003B00081F